MCFLKLANKTLLCLLPFLHVQVCFSLLLKFLYQKYFRADTNFRLNIVIFQKIMGNLFIIYSAKSLTGSVKCFIESMV